MNIEQSFKPIPPAQVNLLPSEFQRRFNVNRRYVMSLRSENLLQNHYMEAGLWGPRLEPKDIHWGWESPTCQLRGHFLGHRHTRTNLRQRQFSDITRQPSPEGGIRDPIQVAREKTDWILQNHHPEPLGEEQRAELTRILQAAESELE